MSTQFSSIWSIDRTLSGATISFDEISAAEFGFERFYHSSDVLISYFFFHLHFIIILLLESFSMIYNWSLSDNKSPQLSRTLLSILADLNNAGIWIISMPSCPFIKPLVTVLRAPTTFCITVTFIFHCFFQFTGIYSSFHFLSILYFCQPRQQSPQFGKFLYFCCCIIIITILLI